MSSTAGQPRTKPYDLLEFLPADAKVVVEVGRSEGQITAYYQHFNPTTRVISLASVLPDLLETLHLNPSNPETHSETDLEIIEPGTVDCIVYQDSLEQIINTSASASTILREQIDWLKASGQVLIGINNAQYWFRIVNLLRGQVDSGNIESLQSSQTGLMLSQIQNFCQMAGLQIYEVQTRGQKTEEFQQFQQLLQPMVKALGLDPNRFATQTAAQRYIIRAVKSATPPRRLLIQTVMMAPTACDRVRVLEPDQLSRTSPGVRAVSGAKAYPEVPLLAQEDKVFIWQRTIMSYEEYLPRLKKLLQQDYLIVAEIDDNPLRRKEYADNRYLSYRGCHAVQTSTEPLATFLRQLNPNVAVFQNQLAYLPSPREFFQQSGVSGQGSAVNDQEVGVQEVEVQGKDLDETVTLFFGALNREPDWQPIMAALNRVLVTHQDRIRVKVIHDRKFFDSLETSQKEFQAFCSYDQYQAILHTCDIGLLPLGPTAVNLMKSDLKFLECAGHGVAVLASPTVYQRSIVPGETGLLYHTVRQFEEQLHQLVVDTALRHQLAENAYDWVRNHRLLCQHYHQRRIWYLQLRDQLPELNRALLHRVPELFTD